MVLNSKLVLWLILILCGFAYGSNRKKYCVFSENKLAWHDARDDCKAKGMMLTCTTTPAEKTDLDKYLRDHFLEPKDVYSGYWIGSHRNSINHHPWIWESNGQQVGTFGWLPGEPNYSDNCMEFQKTTTMGWNNVECASKRRYICESPSHDPDTCKTNNSITTGNSHIIHFLVAVFCLLLPQAI